MAEQEFSLTIGGSGGSELHRLVREELREVARNVERLGQARFFFRTPAPAPIERLQALCAPEKVYAVVLRQPTSELPLGLPGPAAEDALAALIARSAGWSRALETWRACVRRACPELSEEEVAASPRSFRVTGKRAGRLMAHLSSTGISEAAGEAIGEAHGWQVALRCFDVEVSVSVNDHSLLVALPLLERGTQGNFALPGLSQPVAWAIARSADIAPGDVVVDPMCGSGIILLEAARCWSACYMGFDHSPTQLARSLGNLQLLSGSSHAAVSFAQGRVERLPLGDGCCDVLLCDLPFGKQFGSEADNESLYPRAVAEFRRVVRPGTGRAVLLTNLANSERLERALLLHSSAWTVTCRRRLTLGFMEATLYLVAARPSGEAALPPETMRLPWEDSKGRAKWSSLKAVARQPLEFVAASLRREEKETEAEREGESLC